MLWTINCIFLTSVTMNGSEISRIQWDFTCIYIRYCILWDYLERFKVFKVQNPKYLCISMLVIFQRAYLLGFGLWLGINIGFGDVFFFELKVGFHPGMTNEFWSSVWHICTIDEHIIFIIYGEFEFWKVEGCSCIIKYTGEMRVSALLFNRV